MDRRKVAATAGLWCVEHIEALYFIGGLITAGWGVTWAGPPIGWPRGIVLVACGVLFALAFVAWRNQRLARRARRQSKLDAENIVECWPSYLSRTLVRLTVDKEKKKVVEIGPVICGVCLTDIIERPLGNNYWEWFCHDCPGQTLGKPLQVAPGYQPAIINHFERRMQLNGERIWESKKPELRKATHAPPDLPA